MPQLRTLSRQRNFADRDPFSLSTTWRPHHIHLFRCLYNFSPRNLDNFSLRYCFLHPHNLPFPTGHNIGPVVRFLTGFTEDVVYTVLDLNCGSRKILLLPYLTVSTVAELYSRCSHTPQQVPKFLGSFLWYHFLLAWFFTFHKKGEEFHLVHRKGYKVPACLQSCFSHFFSSSNRCSEPTQ